VTEALVVKNKFTGETKGALSACQSALCCVLALVTCSLMCSLSNRACAGFGFVKFATLDAVHAALDMSELPAFRDAVSNRVYALPRCLVVPHVVPI
jgi:hypothetical protein